MSGARRLTRGFTLLEVVFAVVIIATALLGLQAAMSGAILSAADSINRRAARTLARAKMEEILTEEIDAEGSGSFDEEGYAQFSWESRAEELGVGTAEGAPSPQSVRVVTLEVRFPTETGEGGNETLTLVSVLPAEEQPGGGGQ